MPFFAGGPHIMGILNVTPDSFSDGGQFINADKAIEHGLRLVKEGAAILDIGGESTRPGAMIVDPQEEIARVIPVIQGLKGQAPYISIDTRNAATMWAALQAGATMINDVSALTHDPESLRVVAEAGVPVVLMHMQGTPQTMQKNPVYQDVVEEVFEYLRQRIEVCEKHGIDKKLLIADPGFGFGKTKKHNLELLENIGQFQDLGVPILVGLSRKSFTDGDIKTSIAMAIRAYAQGAQIFRVHDVAATAKALKS